MPYSAVSGGIEEGLELLNRRKKGDACRGCYEKSYPNTKQRKNVVCMLFKDCAVIDDVPGAQTYFKNRFVPAGQLAWSSKDSSPRLSFAV